MDQKALIEEAAKIIHLHAPKFTSAHGDDEIDSLGWDDIAEFEKDFFRNQAKEVIRHLKYLGYLKL